MATTTGTSFSGVASGLDSAALIKALVDSRASPIRRLDAQKTGFTGQSKKITDIKTKLTALQTAAKALDTRTEALSNKVSSSDEKVLKVLAQGGSGMGSFEVKVGSLARAERTYSDGFSGSDVAGLFGQGTLGIKVGAKDEIPVTVTAEDTLDSLVRKINASGADVSAGIIKEGGNYRLQITGRSSGASNAIVFTETPDPDADPDFALKLNLDEALNERQEATSAKVTIDKFEVVSETNAVTGAVPGVTLNLVELGTVNVVVDRDPEGLKAKLNTFIAAYNDVTKTLNTEFSYAGAAKGKDSLNADSTMRGLQAALRSVVAERIGNGSSNYNLLASVGVTTQRDGTLMFDDAKYQKAVAADYEGVATLLGGTDGAGLMSKLDKSLEQYTKTDGTIRAKLDNLATRNRTIDKQIASMQTRLDKYEDTLRVQFTKFEKTIGQLNAQGGALSGIMANNSNNK